MGLGDRILSIFRSKPIGATPPGWLNEPPKQLRAPDTLDKLQPGDFIPRREIYPLLTFSGWTPDRIMAAIDQHDQGQFAESELLYHAMRKDGLIASALNTRSSLIRQFPWDLVVPKDAPEEFHILAEMLEKDWQQVMSDEDRGELDERMIMFGFSVASVYWTYCNGQKQMRLKPWTQNSIYWRWDWYAYQGFDQDGGPCRIENDGVNWVVFSKGGLRPWLKGAIRELAYVWFGLMTGDDGWLSLNDGFGRPIKKWITPRVTRESREALDGYSKVQAMRAADTAMCPQDENKYGYDLSYVQADAQGYKTFADQLQRYDDRVAIILLGHNLSQRVSSGSLAATKEAAAITRMLAEADAKILSAGFDPLAATWARVNFGESYELDNEFSRPAEAFTWKYVFDTKPPEDKAEASKTAASYGQAMAAWAKNLDASLVPIDYEASAERAGFVLLPAEQREAFRREAAQRREALDAAALEAAKNPPPSLPAKGSAESSKDAPPKPEPPAPKQSDLTAVDIIEPPWVANLTAKLAILASGDSPDSAAGYIEGQHQVDKLADEQSHAPGLGAILAAAAAASDYGDLRERLTGIVRDLGIHAEETALTHKLQTADHIGRESVDHDLPPGQRTEVDAADRARTQKEKVAEVRAGHERAATAAKVATAYALYSVARHLWDGAETAQADGQPLELHRAELAERLHESWGAAGPLWETANAEPMQRAFTHARARRLDDPSVRAILPYWKYDAVLDGRTTQLCRGLNGLVRPANSPDFPIPPLHWHCRSTVRGLSRAEGEAQVSAAVRPTVPAGFGSFDAMPQPEGGPPELLSAYHSRIRP